MDAVVLSQRQLHVPHTSLTLRHFDISYRGGAGGGAEVVEHEVKADRLRVVVAVAALPEDGGGGGGGEDDKQVAATVTAAVESTGAYIITHTCLLPA